MDEKTRISQTTKVVRDEKSVDATYLLREEATFIFGDDVDTRAEEFGPGEGTGRAAPMVQSRYELQEKLGEGGQAIVFKAYDTELNRHVAIKVIKKQTGGKDFRRALDHEAALMARFNDPNIVPIYDRIDLPGEKPAIVMPFMEGDSVDRIINELTPSEICLLVDHVCTAMHTAHEQGLVHRDLKPSNIFYIDRDKAKPRFVILDLGIAKLFDGSLPEGDASSAAAGTPLYMAPEQFQRGPVDFRADIYACGSMLYELLAGTAPFNSRRTNLATMIKAVTSEEPPPLTPKSSDLKVSHELRELIGQCLAKNPEDRPSSMIEIRDRFLAQFAPARPVPTAWDRRTRWIASAALTACLIFAVAYLSIYGWPSRGVTEDLDVPALAGGTATAAAAEEVSFFGRTVPGVMQEMFRLPATDGGEFSAEGGWQGLSERVLARMIEAESRLAVVGTAPPVDVQIDSVPGGAELTVFRNLESGLVLLTRTYETPAKIQLSEGKYAFQLSLPDYDPKFAPGYEVRKGNGPVVLEPIVLEPVVHRVAVQFVGARPETFRLDAAGVPDEAVREVRSATGDSIRLEKRLRSEFGAEPVRIESTAVDCCRVEKTFTVEELLAMSHLQIEFVPLPEPIGKDAGQTMSLAGVDLDLVWCPAGRFRMGSPSNEPGRGPFEREEEFVEIPDGFWMGQFEVTQEAWEQVMGEPMPQYVPKTVQPLFGDVPGAAPPAQLPRGAKYPVYNISWMDAMAFCAALTERQRNEIPSTWEFRLPTEEEWEYACRAGTRSATAFGEDLDATEAHLTVAGTKGPDGPAEVGSYPPNEWGLYDMHGNVEEWCFNTFHPGPRAGEERAVRGGNWSAGPLSCRSASRGAVAPNRPKETSGFRVVLVRVHKSEEIAESAK